MLKGGTAGPVIVPGDAEASSLIKAVRYADPDLQMPPKDKKLSAEHIAALEAWVKMGAPDPRTASGPRSLTDIAEARARHWAFQPVKNPVPPQVKKPRWVQTPVDAFVLAKLEQKELKPAPPADRRTLIRRISYDLIGLPPTPEEVEAFVKDKRPTPTRNWWIGCWRRRIMASAGGATGWMWRGMRTRRVIWPAARNGAIPFPTPIGITSCAPSTKTSRTTSS